MLSLSVSLLSSPPTAVIRSTSRLWASTVCPPPWFCPPAPRNPELRGLSSELAGHRTHIHDRRRSGFWYSNQEACRFWALNGKAETRRFTGTFHQQKGEPDTRPSLLSVGDTRASEHLCWEQEAGGVLRFTLPSSLQPSLTSMSSCGETGCFRWRDGTSRRRGRGISLLLRLRALESSLFWTVFNI